MSEKQSNNPIPVVNVIIQQDSEVLFAKRKKDPFKDYGSSRRFREYRRNDRGAGKTRSSGGNVFGYELAF